MKDFNSDSIPHISAIQDINKTLCCPIRVILYNPSLYLGSAEKRIQTILIKDLK